MKRMIACAALILAACATADAATFKAQTPAGPLTLETETPEGSLTLYATSAKPFTCEIAIKFSFLDKEGARREGDLLSFLKPYAAGNRVNIYHVEHPNFVKTEVHEVNVTKCTETDAK
jgi:hypothetical protein